MNLKRKSINGKSYYILVLLAAIFIGLSAGIWYTQSRIEKSNGRELSVSFDWTIDNPSDEEIYVVSSEGDAWINGDLYGNQYNFTLYNNSTCDITDWNVSVLIPEGCDIDSSWNGLWAINGDSLYYEPEDYNFTVRAGESKSFGLVMYSVTDDVPMDKIFLEYREDRRILGYTGFWVMALAGLVDALAVIMILISNLRLNNYTKTHAAYKDLVRESLRTMANIIDTKDEYTKGHSLRVGIYSRMLAEKLGMSDYDQERIYYIGLLHDIGKVGIPVSILTKPGHLTDEEFAIIKRHPMLGGSIMKDFTSIPGAINGVLYHHERYDGRGYNQGLRGDEIPFEGRLICVADSYDAMSSKRCYRNTLSYEFILDELKKNSGTQFDPEIARCMIELIEEGKAPISEAEMDDYEI